MFSQPSPAFGATKPCVWLFYMMVVGAGAQGPFVVKLQKQMVPVRRNERTVSHKSAYFGNVSIGYPPQQFSMVIDTGSGHVIVPFESCTSIPCSKRHQYNSQRSKTGWGIDHDGTPVGRDEERDQATIAFGTGEVTGEFISDVVCVSEEINVWSLGFEKDVPPGCTRLHAVTAVDMSMEPFNSFKFDGVLGLGLQPLALTPEFSFLHRLRNAKGIGHPYFSIYLGGHDDNQAEIIFGDYQHERLKGGVRWAPVARPESGHWKLKIESVFVGKERLRICDAGDCVGIVDTGTSVLVVPKSNAVDFQKLLVRKVAENRTDVDCRKEGGPDIHFKISGGLTLSMSVEDYARPAPFLAGADLTSRLKGDKGTNPIASSSSASGLQHSYCRPSMLPMDMKSTFGGRTFIFGESILRKYITVFDWSVPRIGFAPVSKDWSRPHNQYSAMSPDTVTV